MAPLFCPVDSFLLGLGAVEFAIGVIFDDAAGNRISVAAFGSRFNIDVGHGAFFLSGGLSD